MCDSAGEERMIVPPAAAQAAAARAAQLYLRPCPCRVEEQHCPPETWEVCLLLPAAPPERRAEGRPIATAEALALLERMAKEGMIHHLFYRPGAASDERFDSLQVTEICSCCTCCCHPLQRIRAEHKETTERRSAYLAVTDPQRCAGCGTCVTTCFFAARRIEDGTLYLDAGRCFGCGRCAGACPEGAIRLEAQPGRGVPIPETV